jgi:hypothetical protein
VQHDIRRLTYIQGRARLDAVHTYSQEVHSLAVTQESHPPNEVLAALRSIRCTPFERSFLSRLHGCLDPEPKPVLFVDWDTQSPWMDLMEDVRDHYLLSQYVCLRSLGVFPAHQALLVLMLNLIRNHEPRSRM